MTWAYDAGNASFLGVREVFTTSISYSSAGWTLYSWGFGSFFMTGFLSSFAADYFEGVFCLGSVV